MSREQIWKEGGTHDVARFRQHSACEGDVTALLERVDDRFDVLGGIGKVRVGEHPERSRRGEHAARDRETLSTIARVS